MTLMIPRVTEAPVKKKDQLRLFHTTLLMCLDDLATECMFEPSLEDPPP